MGFGSRLINQRLPQQGHPALNASRQVPLRREHCAVLRLLRYTVKWAISGRSRVTVQVTLPPSSWAENGAPIERYLGLYSGGTSEGLS